MSFGMCEKSTKNDKSSTKFVQKAKFSSILGGPAEWAGAPGGVLGGLEILVKHVKLEIGQKVLVI